MNDGTFKFEGTYKEFLQPCILAAGLAAGNGMEIAARLPDAVRVAGGRMALVEGENAVVEAVDYHFPVLLLLDLSAVADWALVIQRCKARPQSRAMYICAFANSSHADLLPQALRTDADVVWTERKLLDALESVVDRQINPPVVYPKGWDDALPQLAQHGLELLNAGDYFDQHEFLEEAWLAEKRPIRMLYQGILQIGVAQLQIERRNWAGAIKMMRRGLPKLRTMPECCQGIDVGQFRRQAAVLHADLCRGGTGFVEEFDPARFLQVRF